MFGLQPRAAGLRPRALGRQRTVCVVIGALAELVSLSFMRGKAYDHLVVECSGIAEPRLVRRLFQDAQAAPRAGPRPDTVQP